MIPLCSEHQLIIWDMGYRDFGRDFGSNFYRGDNICAQLTSAVGVRSKDPVSLGVSVGVRFSSNEPPFVRLCEIPTESCFSSSPSRLPPDQIVSMIIFWKFAFFCNGCWILSSVPVHRK